MEVTDHSATPWLYLLGPDELRDNASWTCFKLYSRKQSQPVNSFLINHRHVLWPKWYLYCFWKIKKKKTPKSVVNTFEDTHCLLGKAQNLSLVQDLCPFSTTYLSPLWALYSALRDPSPPPMPCPFPRLGHYACHSPFWKASFSFPLVFLSGQTQILSLPLTTFVEHTSTQWHLLPLQFHSHMMSVPFPWYLACYLFFLVFSSNLIICSSK